ILYLLNYRLFPVASLSRCSLRTLVFSALSVAWSLTLRSNLCQWDRLAHNFDPFSDDTLARDKTLHLTRSATVIFVLEPSQEVQQRQRRFGPRRVMSSKQHP